MPPKRDKLEDGIQPPPKGQEGNKERKKSKEKPSGKEGGKEDQNKRKPSKKVSLNAIEKPGENEENKKKSSISAKRKSKSGSISVEKNQEEKKDENGERRKSSAVLQTIEEMEKNDQPKKEDQEVKQKENRPQKEKRSCCLCCVSEEEEDEFEAESIIYNFVYDFEKTWALQELGDLTVQTGTWAELRELRSQTSEHGDLAELRVQYHMKRIIPRLKLKNKKAAASVKHRRKAFTGQDLKIPLNRKQLSEDTGYLEVMDTAIHLLGSVLYYLVHHVADLPSLNKAIDHKKQTSRKKSFVQIPPEINRHCKYILREIEKNWRLSVPYLENWLAAYPYNKMLIQKHRSIDKWVVSFYTSSDRMDEISEFGCHLVRAILNHYRIVYEEKDISIDKNSFKDELQDRLNGGTILIPYIFVANLKLGGCRVIWALHKLNLMDDVFQEYMMSPEEFDQWNYELRPRRVEILLNVSLRNYPSLDIVVQQKRVQTHIDNLITIAEGKSVIRASKKKWQDQSSLYLTDLSLFFFVVIKETIKYSFLELDELFWLSLFPSRPYVDDIKTMRRSIKKKCEQDKKKKKKKKGKKDAEEEEEDYDFFGDDDF